MNGSSECPGLIPRTVEALLAKQQDTKQLTIQACYFEIYNEKIFDLLSPAERTVPNTLNLE